MKKRQILIVEDEMVIAMSIADILQSIGHNVCGIARSGEQALEIASSTSPDLAMMDIKIKGSMDGIETAQILRKDHGIPAVFLTAFADQEFIERVKVTQPLGYLLKPFNPSELISVVEIALHKAETEKHIQKIHQEIDEKLKIRTQNLTDEIEARKQTERKLQNKTDYLRQANRALKAMLENREAEKRAIEEELLMNIQKHTLPYVELIEQQAADQSSLQSIDLLKKILLELTAPASKTLFAQYKNLTPQEIKIADLIRHGKTTKDIAQLLNIAPSSVSTYRNHIRKKMGLLNSGTNLQTYLNSLPHKM